MTNFSLRVVCTLMALVMSPVWQSLVWAAAPQVVSTSELREAIIAKTQAREADIQEIQTLLQHEQLQARVGKLVDLNRVDRALPALGDATLAQLAQSVRPVNDRIRAGVEVAAPILVVATAVAVMALVTALVRDPGSDERAANVERIAELEGELDDLQDQLDELDPDDEGD